MRLATLEEQTWLDHAIAINTVPKDLEFKATWECVLDPDSLPNVVLIINKELNQ